MKDWQPKSWFIELVCSECVIRVSVWKPISVGGDGWISIELISNGTARWHSQWGVRLKNAWKVLRNQYEWSGFELNTEEESKKFLDAITRSHEIAYPLVYTVKEIKDEPDSQRWR